MSPEKRIQLMTLVEREFRRESKAPERVKPDRHFKPMKLSLARFNSGWDRKRGSAARLMAIVLRDDDSSLTRRVGENEATAKAYADAAKWLRRESVYLEKTSRAMSAAAGRLDVVLARLSPAHQQRVSN
jgi:hypothetical protein